MSINLNQLPDNLPAPLDDGAADHLRGLKLPKVSLQSTQGNLINIGDISGRVVIYCYPMTGQPGVPLPEGWDEIPGARVVRRKLVHFVIITRNCRHSAQR